jgi:hypothetical protein
MNSTKDDQMQSITKSFRPKQAREKFVWKPQEIQIGWTYAEEGEKRSAERGTLDWNPQKNESIGGRGGGEER